MSNGNERQVQVDRFISCGALKVPIGPGSINGSWPYVIPPNNFNIPYDVLFICTGILQFNLAGPPDVDGTTTGILTTHGPNERNGVPLMQADNVTPVNLIGLVNHQPMTIQPLSRAVQVSLAEIDNADDDNGIWTVLAATLLDPDVDRVEPELEIIVQVSERDGIHLRRVSYSAFFMASTIT